MKWSILSDTFFFEVSVKADQRVTRRKMLSIISSVFDPLGLVGPLVLTGKLLFQEATRIRLDWDDQVPFDLQCRWITWIESLEYISDLKIPRCIKPHDFDDAAIELHSFSDARELSYGYCTFLRCINRH